MTKIGPNLNGILFLLLAMLIISLQSIAVKGLGGSYPVLEMVVLRNLVALPFTLLFFRLEGKRGLPSTPQFKLEFTRGMFLFLSYTTFMMGLAALPLAEVEAIRFSGPLMITLLSVFLLREKVELPRWLALLVGFLGVLLIVRPGSASFNLGSVFILISVLFYALTVISTRKLQATDSSATMAYYSSLVYLAAALVLVPLTLMVGEVPDAPPSLAFLFRAWAMPSLLDGIIMCGLGLVWAGWTYCMARAYSLAQASVAAPFEYLSLPINIIWGFALWREIPTWLTLAGAGLTLLSGMFILYLNRKAR
ncbi:MAG: EamA/RhaT family transporter [Chloroflexi bacterium HGW-Chloroflexi-6]|nr:MAG: EamA/RhaT family transporter [Chloroflexi bacterium HGW-Chloroflexi-6]